IRIPIFTSARVAGALPLKYFVSLSSLADTIFPSFVLTSTWLASTAETVPMTWRPPPWAWTELKAPSNKMTVKAARSLCILRSSCLVMVFLGRRRHILPFQKSHFFVFLRGFPRASWVQAVHLLNFLPCDMRQMADEVDERPGLTILFRCICSPGWHPRETDPVLDDVEDLAVGERLRLVGSHVGS